MKFANPIKKMKPKQLFPLLRLMALFLLAGMYSCTKTEIVPYEPLSNNTVLSYKVTNSANAILGAIDNQANTITVYVPYYLGIDFLVPEIQIDKEAELIDEKGNVINLDGGVLPVPVATTGYSYSVRGKDKVVRKYSLLIKIAPHPDALQAGYLLATSGNTDIDYTTAIEKRVYGRMPIYGNFGSTSANAIFTLTNQETKKVYKDILSVFDVTPGKNYYTMMVNISANAESGNYDVEMQHQGRKTQLPALRLVYGKPVFTNLKSTSSYAPGDTVTFAVRGGMTSNNLNGSVIGLEKVYMKFSKSGFGLGGAYPAGFPEDLFGKNTEMKIVSFDRTQVKVIFPELPAGATGSYRYVYSPDLPGIAFFFDFKDETGWGKNNMLATTGLLFTINPKK